MKTANAVLHPPIRRRRHWMMDVGNGHRLYVEESGNVRGIPVVFIHGGPGSGTSPRQRRFFDPADYRIILYDQRGAGRSTPHASVKHNTTSHLIRDLELIRKSLEIDRWVLFGGSWGSTLALCYAREFPARVLGLILRGVFLLRRVELDWFYRWGANMMFPDEWDLLTSGLSRTERRDIVSTYHQLVTTGKMAKRLDAARRWCRWELSTSHLRLSPDELERASSDRFALAFATIETHYFRNRAFLRSDGELLGGLGRLAGIPCRIVQGRYDVVCPVRSAWDLAKALPGADLRILDATGHSAFEVATTAALVQAAVDMHRVVKDSQPA
jgi:proline iminopeptidase